MHIAPGFLSLPAWGTMAAVSGAAVAASMAVAGRRLDDRKVPLMGVMGAFVFAAQMVNFPILPGTSGHLGGGFLLGIILGAPLGIIVMACVLIVQALLFQDGGVEALGANIFVMGVLPCLLGAAVRGLWQNRWGRLADVVTGAGAVVAVMAGAAVVILLLDWSGRIPARVTFLGAMGLMEVIHLGIGVVEGIISVAVVRFVLATRREAVFGPAPVPVTEEAAA